MIATLLSNPYKCEKLSIYNRGGRTIHLIEFNSVAYIKQMFEGGKTMTISKDKVEATKKRLKNNLLEVWNYEK